MASTTEQKLALQKKIDLKTGQLKAAQAIDATMSAEEIQAAKNTAARIKQEINAARASLSEIEKTDKEASALRKKNAEIKAGTYVPPQAAGVPQDVLQEFKNAGFQITDEAFAMGGALSTMQVYSGEKTNKAYVGSSMQTTKTADVKFSNNVKQDFWKDAAIRNKVKAAMASAGATNVNDITAFDQWGSIVDKAASLYAGGQGPKLTPMDVLNMTVSSNAAANLPRLDVQMQDPNVLREIIRSNYKSTIGRLPNEAEEAARMAELQKIINKGSLTTTKTVGGKKVTTSTPGFTQAGAEALIAEKAKKSAPQDYELKQTSNFNNLLTKWMGSGV
jgi:hypothetical protein